MVVTKKTIAYISLTLLLVSLVGFASAEETIQIDASSYSIWDNFLHTLQNLGLFTAAGQSRECSSSADYTSSQIDGYVSTSLLLANANCDVALFNVFNKDWKFLSEYRSEDIGGFQIASASSYEDYPAIIEVYCCPYPACDSDSDCSTYPSSSYGDYCNIAYGSCYGEVPSYVTDLYRCVSEQWMKYGTASFGEEHYCDEGLNNYIDKNGAEHCVLPTYSSVNDKTWCGVIEEEPDEISTCSELPLNDCKTRNDCVYTKTVPFCEDLTSATCDEVYYETGCAKKSNCEWTGLTCRDIDTIPDTIGQIGDPCGSDLDCISGHCDDEGWFQVADVCQATPWSKLKKVGLERDEISDLTTNDLLSVACLENSECLPINENYTAKCIPISSLKADGTLTIGVDSFFDNAVENINKGIIGGAIGGITGGILCIGGAGVIAIASVPSGGSSLLATPALATVCTAFIGAGAILGAETVIGISDKDKIVDLLEAEDADSVGLCVSEKIGGIGFAKYTEWAAFFNITGDDGVDGLIIILIGLLAMVVVFRR